MNTPRTDANQCQADTGMADDYSPFMVSADFSRQLETELQAMTALADRLAKQLQVWVNASGDRFVRADVEAIAAYEDHKKQTS